MNLDFRSDQAVEGAHAFALAHGRGKTCGACRFSRAFTLQPARAMCSRLHQGRATRMVGVDTPACRLYESRGQQDLGLAIPAAAH